jgi:putative flippase GtrA
MRPSGYCGGGNSLTRLFVAFGREHLLWFVFVGAIASILDIGILYYLCEYQGIWYIPAATFSYCSGIVISYCLNKYFTFHDRAKNYLRQFTTFAVISVSCLMVNICIIWLLVEMVSANYLAAKVVATACAFFWNYYGQSRITFRGD